MIVFLKKNKNGILFRRRKKNIYRKKRKTYQKTLNFATPLRYDTAFWNS